MNSKKDIFAVLFWSIILLIITYISGILAALSTIASLIFYSCITYIFYIIWKKIRKAETLKILGYMQLFLYKSACSLSIVFFVVGGFLYYNNEISPAKMPTYYLSNGEQNITFQAMIHIANPSFYEQIAQDISLSKQDGYVYFFEGVKPGSPESHQAFNTALGIEFDAELYKNFSELYGVVAQDNAQFLGLYNDLDFNIDLNMDQIMELYEQKVITDDIKTQPATEILDANTEIITLLSQLSPQQKKILVYINQAILNFFTKNEALRNTIISQLGNTDIFSVILDDRNQVIADAIIESEYDNIYITYGLLHFDGVLELLQKNNPNWAVYDVDYLVPIQ